ncbi:uncharacterized protein K460DRAFT_291176 [Cucurbitaria berberidis CBS 394.84]|uniref:Zn(2)-C6 fungal-type domain-containing protein n=1 Tax=Cucurbitaria berberidis CBS 394.84 TaxID=1168544 RepID=A0A9P4GES4_9PLEO|nr:uncharacterized protein K460DRAFT_291176 [Cucurbitaria berberidis CBS 394.84]KAF1843909.1 hypothetical protein K460DRAFT_291176 [Cucurbitaria berberidis CBS 394.84]
MSFPPQNASPNSLPTVTAERKTQLPQPRVRRRNRMITSCLECRRRKLKCDKGHPCTNCTKLSRQCVFIASGLDADAQARLAEVKEKMGILERSLEEDVARETQSSSAISASSLKLPGQEASYSDQEDDEDTKDLDPSHLATEDAAYYEHEGNDDVVDLGIAMGKVRITERIGGLVRPRFSEELAQALKELPKRAPSDSIPVSEQDPQTWLAPGRDYVAPASSFFFATGVEKTSLMTHLPSKALVDKLVAHYWIAVHVIATAVHRPSFERQYHSFWASVKAGIEPRISFQAVIFAVLLSSIVSMPEDKVLTEFGVDKQSLVDNFREGTEAALSRANFLRTTKLETLQAFVMYLIPLCRNEVSRAHSALTGTLIRLAECMGLHRDPTTYSTSPIEIQVRRLVWYQICFLDLRTSEATGPRPQIRPDDYDTQFPLNIDDIDLDRAESGESGVDVRTDRTHFTDMTITRMRFECYEMHRFLWNERPKLEMRREDGERKVTITSLLSRVQSFKAAMEKTYVPMLSKTVPLHALASEMYGILSGRLYILLLQKYLSSDRSKMPDRLRQVIMSSSIMILEHSMTIEQQPALSMWSWYIGALHQYHVALLLISELYAGPRELAIEQRVWKGLDFAFDLSSGTSNLEKVRIVLEDLIGKTQIYASMKGVRVPNQMPHAGPRTHTPGYQARQQEAREERDRSGSLQSTESSAGAASFRLGRNVAEQQTSSQQQQPYAYQSQQSQGQTMSFPGSMPTIDWGTIDLPASAATFQQPRQPLPPPESFSHRHRSFAGGSIPTNMMASTGQRQGSDGSSPGAAIHAYMVSGTADSSPMDALNEIDWNDIELMFGGAEMDAGNMLIPPYTFPQFSATDLQWPAQEGSQ